MYGTATARMTPCTPLYRGRGRQSELMSRWRGFIAPLWDCRTAAERNRDGIAARGDRLLATGAVATKVGAVRDKGRLRRGLLRKRGAEMA